MTTNRFRRGAASLLAASLMIVGTALPAAAIAVGTVTLDDTELLSGVADQDLVFTVSNNAANTNGGLPVVGTTTKPINLVQLVPPTGLLDAFIAADFTVPTGWTAYVQSDIVRFVADEGAGILATESAVFGFAADVDDQPFDKSDFFFASISDDKGLTLTSNVPIEVFVRTLEVVISSLEVVKPLLANDQQGTNVTQQQDNATISVQIRNNGDASQIVSPVIAKDSGSSSITPGSVGAQSIAADGGVWTFVVPATFGNPGSLTLKANATSSEGSQTVDGVLGSLITVQERILLAFTADNLSPKAINPSISAIEGFTASVDKTGGPATDTAGLTLDYTVASENVTASPSFDAGSDTEVVTFPTIDFSGVADGSYNATATVAGFDANYAAVDSPLLDFGFVLIDRILAVVTIALAPPLSAVDHPDTAPDHASFNDSVGVTGTVTREVTAGSPEGCSDCSISVSTAKISGTELDPSAVSLSVDSFGDITGTITMPGGTPEAPGVYQNGMVLATTLTLDVTVGRLVGGTVSNAGFGNASAPIDITRPFLLQDADNTAGEFAVTKTGRDETGDFVIVALSEPVAFGGAFGAPASDWLVSDSTVTSIEFMDGGTADGTRAVRLRLLEALGNNDTPSATYAPQPLSSPAFDRVELDVFTPDAVDTIDGIAPETLELLSVSTYRDGAPDNTANEVQQGAFDGTFVTRDASPTLVVADVLSDDTVHVFNDLNGDGILDPGEPELATQANQEPDTADVKITVNLPGTGDRTIDIGVYAKDVNLNRGVSVAGLSIEVDQTQAAIVGLQQDGQTVTVTLSEALTSNVDHDGRDAAIDWFVFADGRWRPVDTSSNQDGNNATRSLTLNALVVPAGASVTEVRYEYITFGTEDPLTSERHRDVALNNLPDGAYTAP
jgi:hypothetical protein